ncbi:hypothetical protein SEH50133_17204 [Salmonella enterica subsp. houtenae serovar 50:g,z51:- str. 01-0133]|nr:hypothetical protein SEHO0A_01376 [Salmonella enterica subsp. houtenae str. ATCC BAA-1581]ENZ87097.1 hypothetical protein D088_760006 [Salmonella enterica subsp. houtenae serovar 16:z4,z32:-- str. RKS3027]ESE84594.1 hypothetical protein SEH50133_17204 [Salmonella enterica subsp. houtenae serovar 50:g,z51:- str. 01-0133]
MLSSVKFLHLKNGRFLHCEKAINWGEKRYLLLFKVKGSDMGHYLKK